MLCFFYHARFVGIHEKCLTEFYPDLHSSTVFSRKFKPGSDVGNNFFDISDPAVRYTVADSSVTYKNFALQFFHTGIWKNLQYNLQKIHHSEPIGLRLNNLELFVLGSFFLDPIKSAKLNQWYFSSYKLGIQNISINQLQRKKQIRL